MIMGILTIVEDEHGCHMRLTMKGNSTEGERRVAAIVNEAIQKTADSSELLVRDTPPCPPDSSSCSQ